MDTPPNPVPIALNQAQTFKLYGTGLQLVESLEVSLIPSSVEGSPVTWSAPVNILADPSGTSLTFQSTPTAPSDFVSSPEGDGLEIQPKDPGYTLEARLELNAISLDATFCSVTQNTYRPGPCLNLFYVIFLFLL